MRIVLRRCEEGEITQTVIEDFFDIQFQADGEQFKNVSVSVSLAENKIKSRPEIKVRSGESLVLSPEAGNSIVCGYQRF